MSLTETLPEAKEPKTAEELFPELAALSPAELSARRSSLIGDASTYSELNDAQLTELSAVITLLKRGSSGPPKLTTKGKPKPTVDDVL